MAVAENVRGDLNGVTGFALDGESPGIYGWLDIFNDKIVFFFRNGCHSFLHCVESLDIM